MGESTAENIEIRPHHLGISVPDLEASIAWYHDIFGFTVAKRENLDAIPAKIAFLKCGDFYIELFEVPGAAPLPESRRYPDRDLGTHGTKHLAFVVDDLRQVAAKLKKRGVDIAMGGKEGETPRAVFIRDNAGNLIELVPPTAPYK